MAAEAMLPRAVSEEILRRYADVLRVGRLLVNGRVLAWETDTSTELQLQSFCHGLFSRLSEVLPDIARTNPAVLRFAAYWFCKSVSINYALIEVLLLIKQKVGVLCTIETRQPGCGSLVDYALEAIPGSNLLRVSLIWRRVDNIVYRDIERPEKQVKGTLSCLATEFRLPPDEGFVPAYCLQMRLRRSMAARLASRLACGGARRPAEEAEKIFIEEPLRSHHSLETEAELAARPPPAEPLEALGGSEAARPLRPRSPRVAGYPAPATGAADAGVGAAERGPPSAGSECLSGPTLESSPSRPCSRQQSTTSWTFGEDCALLDSSPEALLGHLRVRVLRARTAPQDGHAHALNTPERRLELYATCTLAGRTERTRTVADGLRPEWLEAWCFPIRGQDLREDIIIEVFDNGMYGACDRLDFLGRVTVPVSAALSDASAVAITEPLRAAGEAGSVDLELELLPRPAVAPAPAPEEDGPAAAGVEDEECSVEVGSSFSLATTSPTPAPVGLGPVALGEAVKVAVKVTSAPPAVGLRGLWCSKACSLGFS